MVRSNRTARGSGRSRATRPGVVSTIAVVLAMAAAGVLAGPSAPADAATQVNLGTAGAFAVLADSAITNTGPTVIRGDIGIYDGTAVTGYDEIDHRSGELHATDGVAQQAQADLTTAYNNAASQPATPLANPELGDRTLLSGVYSTGSGFQLTGELTLDAQGTAGKVWIFQMGSTLTTASASSVNLINGAHPCNVFWQVGSSATLGTGTDFAGNILASESITLTNGAEIRGRALADNGAVTMDSNTITRSFCPTQNTPDPPAPAPSPSPTPTVSPSPSPAVSPSPSPTPSPSASSGPTASPSSVPVPIVSPSEVAVPVDSTTGTPGAPDEPDAPEAAAPPTDGTPQVPAVPRGPVPAGDGSMAAAGGGSSGFLLLPVLAGLVLAAVWRRRDA